VTFSCQFSLFGSFEIFILVLLGAKTKDVVVQVVTALEDCPLFNAGNL
jgi:isoaspartyl peptidase/L-asparaginase-like protein (Ntn-hydrolase superfamily)